MRVPGKAPAAIAALLTGVLLAVGGCSGTVNRPAPAPDVLADPVRPDFVHGTDGGEIDILAATVVTDAQVYWSKAYPRHFPGRWRDLDGGFFSVDTTRTGADPPPCTSEVSDVEGNAYYCATVDAIAWDRAALLPVLREHYGAAAVVVVLAHEMGHAVQHRATSSGETTSGGAPARSPAFTELVADCYAGAYTHWVVSGNSGRLRIGEHQLDGAMRALAGFRDPVGTPNSATSAHGSALDRVAAFQDGFRAGPGLCSGMTPGKRMLSGERGVVAPDPAEHGNRTPEDVLRSHTADLDTYFGGVSARLGRRWQPPEIAPSRSACVEDSSPGTTAAITYCPRGDTLAVDRRRLARVNYEIGDQASVTVLASRYALAFLHGRPERGPAATAEAASCLTGAYTRWLRDGRGNGAGLTAGDMDEAITALLSGEGVTGTGELSGFDAVMAFRSGLRGGAPACR